MIATLLVILAAVMGSGESRVEGKVSYYYPTNSDFRNTYYEGSALYGIEFCTQVYRSLYPWVNIGYSTQSGSTPGDHYHTRVSFYPVSLGLKYLFPLFYYPEGCKAKSPVNFYVGAGILGEFLRTENNSPAVKHIRSKCGIGGAFKSGIFIDVNPHLFIDVFVDYYYMNISFSKTNRPVAPGYKIDTSGLSTGLGIGYRF